MRWNANQKRSGPRLKAKANDVPIEQSHELGREASKHAVGRLVIQFRIERASRRVAWFAIITFVVALILGMPGGPSTNRQADACELVDRQTRHMKSRAQTQAAAIATAEANAPQN
jgi:hypothetical protein